MDTQKVDKFFRINFIVHFAIHLPENFLVVKITHIDQICFQILQLE